MIVRAERLTAENSEGLVVMLIGARVNRWWLMPILWGVSRAMNRMMAELTDDPESGLMSYESFAGRTTLMVQYWRSLDDLHRFAHNKERQHVPAWRRWIKEWGPSGAVGIWHETYIVSPGAYESVYHHMPPFGLGRVGELVVAKGALSTARGRLRSVEGTAAAA